MEIKSNTLNDNVLEPLKIEHTFATPEVLLDYEKGIFCISGNSYPEDPLPIYIPVIDWFKRYIQNPLPKTVFEFKFSYFSTASTQMIFEIFRMMEEVGKEHEVLVRWYYSADNEEIHENGEDFSALFDIPFEVVEVDEIDPDQSITTAN
jgi:hypothetical protein